MGIIIYSFNLNMSVKMSHDVLECDIVMLQNYSSGTPYDILGEMIKLKL